jgi:hypothetical protein
MTEPSLVLIPSVHKPGKLYSVIPADGSGDFIVSRNGTATRFNKDGLIESVPANVPRLNYNPVTWEFIGVLVEPGAANLIRHSHSFTQPSWSNIGSVIITPGQNSPDGGVNSSKIADQQTGILGFSRLTQLVSVPSNTNSYTAYVFVKRDTDESRFPSLRCRTSNTFLGDIILNTKTGEHRVREGQVMTVGGVLHRGEYWILFGSFSNTNGNSITIEIIPAYNSNFSDTPNPDTIGEITIYGTQLETGSVPTSYIPTEGSQVTRPEDVMTVTIPISATQAIYTLNGTQVTQAVTGGATFQLPNGHIRNLYFL